MHVANRPHRLQQWGDPRPQAAVQHAPRPRWPALARLMAIAEQPKGKGAVGDQFDAKLPATVGHTPWRQRFGGQKRDLHLHAAQPLRAHVRHPQAGGSAGQHQIRQSVEQGAFLPRRVAGGAPVQLDPVELALQALERRIKGAPEAAAAQPPGEGGQLGGHAQRLPLARRQGRSKAADQGFAAAAEPAGSIRIGGVEKPEAPRHRPLERDLQFSVVPLGLIVPKKLVAPGPGAHPDGRNCHHQRSRLQG
jgi:hypothetical protein